MSDEQTIYISPEDDLTTVRERLEEITSRRVTLVIPSHTQLRSHVAWKLLYARSRELGKEVLIVSSDPQVRSVAHAVKFKVAHSLESNPQGRPRPNSRPTRSTSIRSKFAAGRTPKSVPRNTNSLRQRQPEPEDEAWYAPPPTEKRAATRPERHDYHIEEVHGDDITDVSISPRYKTSEKAQPQTYEYRIDPLPDLTPIHSVSPDMIEEESDMLVEDYAQAQDIRQAAGLSRPEQSDLPSTPDIAARAPTPDTIEHETPPSAPIAEPFEHEEDSQPAFAHEQRGNATIEDIDTIEHGAPDLGEMPTSILEHKIEYHDDNDDYLPPASKESDSWGQQNRQETLDGDDDDVRRVQGARPGRGRSGYLSPSKQANTAASQPVNENYSTQIVNPPPFLDPTTSSASRGGGKEPDPVQLPTPTREGPRPTDARSARARSGNLHGGARSGDLRNARARSGDLRGTAGARPADTRSTGSPRSGDLRGTAGARPADTRSTGSPRSGDLRSTAGARPADTRSRGTGAPPPATRPQRPLTAPAKTSLSKPTAGNRRINTIIVAAVVVVLIAIALLIYAGPIANVTLVMAAHNYTHAVELTASNNNQAGELPARLLVRDFHKQGPEPVTGSKMVGTAKSKGFVCFTNKNDTSVEIPTGSVISTSTGAQFATTADGVVLAHSTCANDPLTFPIQAIKPGETGNVQAGSITIIPDNSLDTIAKYNKVALTSLKLAVSNSEDVKGGGMQPVPAIAAKDLDNAKKDLSNQLKGDINTWVQDLSKEGVTGNVTTNITLVDAPLQDTTLDAGTTTFPTEVDVKATILFVTNADVQKAALNQLNIAINQDKNYTGYTLAQDAKPPLVISQLKKQPAANSLKINFSAVAQAIPIVPKETVQNLVSGRTPDAARNLLMSSIRGTQRIQIQVTPSFFPWVSWWKGHINVTILPGSTSNNPPAHT